LKALISFHSLFGLHLLSVRLEVKPDAPKKKQTFLFRPWLPFKGKPGGACDERKYSSWIHPLRFQDILGWTFALCMALSSYVSAHAWYGRRRAATGPAAS